jgi:hypothetical protein
MSESVLPASASHRRNAFAYEGQSISINTLHAERKGTGVARHKCAKHTQERKAAGPIRIFRPLSQSPSCLRYPMTPRRPSVYGLKVLTIVFLTVGLACTDVAAFSVEILNDTKQVVELRYCTTDSCTSFYNNGDDTVKPGDATYPSTSDQGIGNPRLVVGPSWDTSGLLPTSVLQIPRLTRAESVASPKLSLGSTTRPTALRSQACDESPA